MREHENAEVNPDYDEGPQDRGDPIELLVPPEVNNSNLRQVHLALESAGFNVEKLHTGVDQRVYAISPQSESDHADFPQNEAAERANHQPPSHRGEI